VLSEMLTGQRVYDGESVMHVCQAQVSSAPVPHSPRVLRSRLGPIIHRATQKSIERRYGSAGDMLRELEAMTQPSVGTSMLGAAGTAAASAVAAGTPMHSPSFHPGSAPPPYAPSHPSPSIASQPAYAQPAYSAPSYAPPVQPSFAGSPPGPQPAPRTGIGPLTITILILLGMILFAIAACGALTLCVATGTPNKTGSGQHAPARPRGAPK
jgi:hypothetical protein